MDEKPSRMGNIKAQLSDGSTRIKFFGGLGVIMLAAASGYFMFRSSTGPKAESSQVAQIPDISQQTHTNDNGLPNATPAYDKLIAKENASQAEVAKETGDSAVPVIRSGVNTKPEKTITTTVVPPPITQTQSNNVEQQQHDEMQHRQEEIANRAAAMKNQVNLLIAAWQPKDHVSLAVRETVNPTDLSQKSGSVTPGGQGVSAVSDVAAQSQQPVQMLTKAGDVFYAVLDTAVNTDEMSPIFATIVQGELKGAKILGKVEVPQNSQKAILKFNVISIPGEPTSRAIDAVAIDPDTKRTALASDVDNHYLLRYGTLFASSFLSGFGDALMKGGQNQQVIASPSGAIVQQSAYSTAQLVQMGIGNVGKTTASNMTSVVNRPATITINAGVGLGILFMSDLARK